ncbi:MAG: hypothetical protein K5786_05805 [Treponema sp.]|nr:hypothetical protein [Treponema sp.]
MDWKKIIDEIENETGKSIYKELNIRPAYISDLKSGKSKIPNSDFVLNLIKHFNINPNRLLNGQGPIFASKGTLINNIKIQHITLSVKSVLFLWITPEDSAKLKKTIEAFADKTTSLFITYYTKDFPEGFANSACSKEITETCSAHNIEVIPFEVSESMLKNPDSISSIKECMILNIFPRIQMLKPTKLTLGLSQSNKSSIININHALLGLYVLDHYFSKSFPEDCVNLCQIEEKLVW